MQKCRTPSSDVRHFGQPIALSRKRLDQSKLANNASRQDDRNGSCGGVSSDSPDRKFSFPVNGISKNTGELWTNNHLALGLRFAAFDTLAARPTVALLLRTTTHGILLCFGQTRNLYPVLYRAKQQLSSSPSAGQVFFPCPAESGIVPRNAEGLAPPTCRAERVKAGLLGLVGGGWVNGNVF